MAQLNTAQDLKRAVDELWKNPNARAQRAGRLVSEMSNESWLVLAAWDTAASYGPVGGQLEIDTPNSFRIADQWGRELLIGVLGIDDNSKEVERLITYGEDRPFVIRVSGSLVPSTVLRHDAVAALMTLQLIRDHLDSALLKPRDLRDAELDQFASSVGIESDHFRRLAAWYSTISRLLQ